MPKTTPFNCSLCFGSSSRACHTMRGLLPGSGSHKVTTSLLALDVAMKRPELAWVVSSRPTRSVVEHPGGRLATGQTPDDRLLPNLILELAVV